MNAQQRQKYAAMLHIQFCKRQHSDDMRDLLKEPDQRDNCCWYLEEQVEDTWAAPDHVTWSALAEYLHRLVDGHDETTEAVIMQAISQLCRAVENIKSYNYKLWEFISGLF